MIFTPFMQISTGLILILIGYTLYNIEDKNSKSLNCELCGDPASTWSCFGDGEPKRVCQGCSDSIDKFMGHKCDMACIKKEDKLRT